MTQEALVAVLGVGERIWGIWGIWPFEVQRGFHALHVNGKDKDSSSTANGERKLP